MVDGSAPGQVTDMLVGFKTPAWVLEIAGKTHQTRPQITILIVIEVCALQLRHPHMLGSSSELWYRYTVLKRFLTVILYRSSQVHTQLLSGYRTLGSHL